MELEEDGEIEVLIKICLLYFFSLLNAIDLAQTFHFLRLGIESNPFAVHYPQLWFLLKFAFTFGLPIGLHRLDTYLDEKEEGGAFYDFLKSLLLLLYFTVLLADIFYLGVVLRNMSFPEGIA